MNVYREKIHVDIYKSTRKSLTTYTRINVWILTWNTLRNQTYECISIQVWDHIWNDNTTMRDNFKFIFL